MIQKKYFILPWTISPRTIILGFGSVLCFPGDPKNKDSGAHRNAPLGFSLVSRSCFINCHIFPFWPYIAWYLDVASFIAWCLVFVCFFFLLLLFSYISFLTTHCLVSRRYFLYSGLLTVGKMNSPGGRIHFEINSPTRKSIRPLLLHL